MTSRAYRGIRIFLIPLLAISCFLVLQTVASSSASKAKGNDDKDLYDELKEAIKKYRYTVKSLEEVQTSTKCPFVVLNVGGCTHVLCDFRNCTHGNQCYEDCEQAYTCMKAGRKKRQAKCVNIYVGCIYIPKNKNHSKETAVPKERVG
jgi:hypothetical protein